MKVLVIASLANTSQPHAQSLTAQLSTLLTEQRPTPAPFVPDPAAAAATLQTVAGLFQVELANLPLASSSGGFIYRLNRSLGAIERASDAFGPFFAERTLQNGRGQTSIGISQQFSSFTSLQGADLTTGTFPTNASRFIGGVEPFSVDTLQLEMESRTTTIFASHGITDRLAVGGSLPVTNVSFWGQRMRTVNGESTLQSLQEGSATGLGDVALNARYLLTGNANRGFSVGGDLRFPTGREEDLLGAGRVAARTLAFGSWEEGKLAVHLNGGVGFGGVSREFFWNSATTFAVLDRVTIVGEIMGRRLSALSRVQDVYQSDALVSDVETMRWLGSSRGVYTTFLVTGVKWNVAQTLLLNANLLIRVTDPGLRARVTPAVSVAYAFER